MEKAYFPDFIKRLPEADLPIEGLRGWLLQSANGQMLFLVADAEVDLPEHTHGEQWGFVVDGSVELTIGDETRTRVRGDSYYIPAGTPHKAILHRGFMAVDFFADRDRYRARSGG